MGGERSPSFGVTEPLRALGSREVAGGAVQQHGSSKRCWVKALVQVSFERTRLFSVPRTLSEEDSHLLGRVRSTGRQAKERCAQGLAGYLLASSSVLWWFLQDCGEVTVFQIFVMGLCNTLEKSLYYNHCPNPASSSWE